MALITSCQATFQNFSGYEDDIASLEENIRECYSEITKTSEQINMVRAGRIYFPLGTGDHPEGFRDQYHPEQHGDPDGFHGHYG